MLIIHLHGILPKLPIQLFRARTIAKPLNEFGTVLPRNINCACVVVDHVKFLGDRAERIQRAAASAFKRVDHADFVNRGTVQRTQFAEIALHCLRRSGIGIVIQRSICRTDGLSKQWRSLLRTAENGNDAVLCGTLALTVAASGGLQNGIQTRQFTINGGEIYVNTGFNKRSRYDTAGQTVIQSASDFLEHRTAMLRHHQCGQVETAFLRQLRENGLRCFAGIDNAENLLMCAQLLSESVILEYTDLPECHTAEFVKIERNLRTNLGNRVRRCESLYQIAEYRLGSRTQHSGCAELLYQSTDGCNARHQVAQRKHLRFVENNHAVRQIVQLAAL